MYFVFGVSILSLSTILIFDLDIVPAVWYFGFSCYFNNCLLYCDYQT